jgi:hypothetical protein
MVATQAAKKRGYYPSHTPGKTILRPSYRGVFVARGPDVRFRAEATP